MKNISILGSTGSIGTQTLDVAEVNKEFNIVALCANKNVSLIEQQIRKFKPLYAAMMDETAANELKIKVADLPTISEFINKCVDYCFEIIDDN